jgi:hypothetical protein
MREMLYGNSVIPASINCLLNSCNDRFRIGTAKDSKYLHFLLELVEGMTLDKVLQMFQKLRLEYATLIIIQVTLILIQF